MTHKHYRFAKRNKEEPLPKRILEQCGGDFELAGRVLWHVEHCEECMGKLFPHERDQLLLGRIG